MDMALYTIYKGHSGTAAFANFDLVAICENDLKPKNFSAYGHGPIYYI